MLLPIITFAVLSRCASSFTIRTSSPSIMVDSLRRGSRSDSAPNCYLESKLRRYPIPVDKHMNIVAYRGELYHSSRMFAIVTRLHQAMSSEDIKNEKTKKSRKRRTSTAVTAKKRTRTKLKITKEKNISAGHQIISSIDDDELIKDPQADLPMPSSKGIARLSRAVAKASADREKKGQKDSSMLRSKNSMSTAPVTSHSAPAESPNSRFEDYPKYTNTRPRKSTNNFYGGNDDNIDDHKRRVKSLTQLTRVIDSQLYANGPRGTRRGDYPKLDGLVQNARDNMMSLLGFNQVQGDWKIHSSTSTYNVAIVFGKELVRDQVTVEYASRIRTLARLFKNEPEFHPSLVCFCGGIADGSHVANSDAGYIFFRHMCEAQGIDLNGVEICIDNKSRSDDEAINSVTEEIKSTYIPKWLSRSPTTTDTMQKSIDMHFTLISTEYHLCNINDVHHRSPERSLLNAMENIGDSFTGNRNYSVQQKANAGRSSNDFFIYYDDDENGSFGDANISSGEQGVLKSNHPAVRGLVKTSWSFQYATYPYIYAKSDSTVFLGKCFLLGEELMPLLVNMKGVVEQREFFQRDNYLMLASIRRSLVEHIEALHKPSHSTKKAMKNELRRIKDVHGNERDVIRILEGALLSLGRCCDMVKPAGLHVGSVTKDDWKRALRSLEHSMSEIRTYCDPDRPLLPSEWGKLVGDDSHRD